MEKKDFRLYKFRRLLSDNGIHGTIHDPLVVSFGEICLPERRSVQKRKELPFRKILYVLAQFSVTDDGIAVIKIA